MNNARKRKLLVDLHYFQMQTRIDINSLKASRRKCKEIGIDLRNLQREETMQRKSKTKVIAIYQKPTHIYVARRDCGCVVGICNDDKDKRTGAAVGEWISEGLSVDHVTFEEYKNKISNEKTFLSCPHSQLPLPNIENPVGEVDKSTKQA